MSFWKKSDTRPEDEKKSEALIKKRDELLKKFPEVQSEWEKEDQTTVRAAAEELCIVEKMQNWEKILEARKALQQAVWKRDADRENLQRQIDQIGNEIENINRPVIAEKWPEWQGALSELFAKKIVQRVETTFNVEKETKMVRFRSNLPTVALAKEKLTNAISGLRGMNHSPLAEVSAFVKRNDEEIKVLDFSVLTEAKEPVSERRFDEISSAPGTTVYTTARMEAGRIVKNFNLPVREL